MRGYEPQSRAGRVVLKVLILAFVICIAVGICWAVLFGPKDETEVQHKIGEQNLHNETRHNAGKGDREKVTDLNGTYLSSVIAKEAELVPFVVPTASRRQSLRSAGALQLPDDQQADADHRPAGLSH